MRTALLAGVLGVALLPASRPALAVDSLVVGGTKAPFNRSMRWTGLRFESRRMNLSPDSIWKWDVAPHTNIAPGLFKRGGRIAVLEGGAYFTSTDEVLLGGLKPIPGTAYFGETVRAPFPTVAYLADGDPGTAYRPDGVEASRASAIHIDLGEIFGVERIRLYPRLDPEHRGFFPQIFEVGSYGGSDAPLVMTANAAARFFAPIPRLSFSPVLRNASPLVDERFLSRPVRYLRVDVREERPWELAEVEVYADGTLPRGEYTSNAIAAITDHPVWGHVRLDRGSVADLAAVIQTATGPSPEHTLYFRQTGVEGQYERVSAGQYAELSAAERGPVKRNPSWSPFETLRDGVVASPGARRFLQFRVFVAEPGEVLRQLIFEYARIPLAVRLTGEIDPPVMAVGRDTTFTLSVQVYTRTEELKEVETRGFRRIRVNTTAAVHEVTEVTVRDRPALYTVGYDPGRGFDVHLGRRITRDGTFVQIRFRGAVFRDGTRFEVQARDVVLTAAGLDTVYQVAVPENVEPRTPGGVLTVRLTDSSQRIPLVSKVRVRPPVLTPNGDRQNDAATIAYDLVRLTSPAPVRVTVHDLSGRRVRTLFDGHEAAGRRAHRWDGRDDAGRLLPPGLYLCRIEVRAARGTAVRRIVVRTAY